MIFSSVIDGFAQIEDNKISEDGFMSKVAIKISNNEDDKAKAKAVVHACSDVTDDDRCESAYKIWKCVEDVAMKKNLTLF